MRAVCIGRVFSDVAQYLWASLVVTNINVVCPASPGKEWEGKTNSTYGKNFPSSL